MMMKLGIESRLQLFLVLLREFDEDKVQEQEMMLMMMMKYFVAAGVIVIVIVTVAEL